MTTTTPTITLVRTSSTLRYRDIAVPEQRLYAYIHNRVTTRGRFVISNRHLADNLNLRGYELTAARQALVDAGLITVQRKRTGFNTYTLTDAGKAEVQA